MEVRENDFYLSAQGEVVYARGGKYDDEGYHHNKGNPSQYDLIASVPGELHYEICRVIKEYHTNKEFKYIIDKIFEQNTKGKQNV